MSRRYKGLREAARADCGTGPGWHGPEFSMHGLEGVVQVAKKPRGRRAVTQGPRAGHLQLNAAWCDSRGQRTCSRRRTGRCEGADDAA